MSKSANERWPRKNFTVMALVAALHAGLLYVLVHRFAPHQTSAEPPPLFVSILSTPAPIHPEAVPQSPHPVPPPKPRLEPPRPAIQTPRPAPVQKMIMETTPKPEVRSFAPSPPVAQIAPAAAPSATVVPPNFDAAYLNNPAPAYPPISRKLGESGSLLLRAHIGADGHCDAVELIKTSGSERLDTAAEETVRKWRFVAAHQGAEAISAWVIIPINFELDQ